MAEAAGTGLDFAFGQIAVRENFATLEQVKECLDIQQKLKGMGLQLKPLGNLMVEKGYLSPAVVDQILRLQATQTSTKTSGAGATGVKVQIPGYELLSKIGQGAMGAVYRAKQISMDRIVAIKVLAPKYSTDASFVRRFVNEARAVARLNHENIIAGIDVGEAGGLHFFVMEFVNGSPVVNQIHKEGKIPEKRCIDIATQIGRALDHAHHHQIVHRDVKPENIMITLEGVAKLCDLGLAKQLSGDASLTMEGMSVGTPNYISPEQARGEKEIDIRSDIYSLGATLYHMATGTTPFSGANPMTVMTKHVTDDPEAPQRRNPQLSGGLSAIILKMMAKGKDRRYQSPAELVAELERLAHRGAATAAAAVATTVATPPPRSSPSSVPAATRVSAPIKMNDSRISDARDSSTRPSDSRVRDSAPHRRVAVAPKKSHAGLWFMTILALLVAGGVGAVLVVKKIQKDQKDKMAKYVETALPDPVKDDPKKIQEQEDLDAFNQAVVYAMNNYTDLRDKRPEDAIIKGLERFERDAAKAKGGKFEAEWQKKVQEFRDIVNKEITDKWSVLETKARALRDAAQYGEALAVIREFPEYLKFFKREPSKLYTKPGGDAEELAKDILGRLDQQFELDKAEAIAHSVQGRFEAALGVLAKMKKYSGGEKDGDLGVIRERVMDKLIDSLTAAPMSIEAVIDARNRLETLRQEQVLNKEFAARKSAEVDEKFNQAVKTAAKPAKTYYAEEFKTAAAKQFLSHDFMALRKLFLAAYFGPKWEARQPALLLNQGDASLIKKYLEPAAGTPIDYMAVVKACEEGARIAELKGDLEGARELYLDLREMALIEELSDQILRGAEFVSKDLASFQRFLRGIPSFTPDKSRLIDATSMKALPRSKPSDPFALEVVLNGATVKFCVAPRGEMNVDDTALLSLMNRSYGADWTKDCEKDPYRLLRMALFAYYEGEGGVAAAKNLLGLVPPVLQFGRYKGLADVMTTAEERDAEILYNKASDLFMNGKKEEAQKVCRELKAKYWNTHTMKTAVGKTTRQGVLLELYPELEKLPGPSPSPAPKDNSGSQKPAKFGDLLHGAKAKEGTKNQFEVVYEFDSAEALEDWTAVETGLGKFAPRVEVTRGGLEVDDTAMLLWKPALKGDVTEVWKIKARDTKNIGFVIHGAKGFTEGQGYVCWLNFKAPSKGQWKDGLRYTPKHAIFSLPAGASAEEIEAQAGRINVGADVDAKWQPAMNGSYTVTVIRKAKSIDVLVDNKPVSKVESDGKYNSGQLGLMSWGSQVTVESAKFSVTVDATWLDEQLKK